MYVYVCMYVKFYLKAKREAIPKFRPAKFKATFEEFSFGMWENQISTRISKIIINFQSTNPSERFFQKSMHLDYLKFYTLRLFCSFYVSLLVLPNQEFQERQPMEFHN